MYPRWQDCGRKVWPRLVHMPDEPNECCNFTEGPPEEKEKPAVRECPGCGKRLKKDAATCGDALCHQDAQGFKPVSDAGLIYMLSLDMANSFSANELRRVKKLVKMLCGIKATRKRKQREITQDAQAAG